MKKYIMLFLCLMIMISLWAEPVKVALGNLKNKDRDSDYIVSALIRRDLKDVFKSTDEYDLMDINKTFKLIEKSSDQEFVYLKKEDKIRVAQEIGAEIIFWGDVTSLGNNRFSINFNVLSTKTNEFITTSFVVPKNTDERKAALIEFLFCELDNSCLGSSQMILDIALQQFSTRNFDQAEESFLAVLGGDSNNVQALYYLGAINYIQREYDQSLEYFQMAYDLQPDNNDILNQLRLVYTRLEMYEDAIDAIQQMSDIDENPSLWMNIADLYKNIEFYHEAQLAYEKVIALTDTLDKVYLDMANLLYDLEYFEDALPYLEEASKRFPNDAPLNKKLATAYRRTGKIENAIKQYQELIKTNPDNLQAYYNLANAYTSLNDYQKALNTTLELEKKDPENPNVYILLSNSYSSLKNYDAAEKAVRKLLKLNPDEYQGYRILSEIYQGKGYIKYEQFLEYEEKAKTLYGKDADDMIDLRDATKQEAYDFFTSSNQYLQEAKSRTSAASELGYIREREKTLAQLLEATKKSFF
jgi:tetratricopeptide (TPR) repeat protein